MPMSVDADHGEIRREALDAFAQSLEQLLTLMSRNAAQLLEEMDGAVAQPISALATVNGIAADGAEIIRSERASFLESTAADAGAAQPCAHRALTQACHAFAGAVADISDHQAASISDEVSASMTAAQRFDLVRQQIGAVAQMADLGASRLQEMRAALAADDAPSLAPIDLQALNAFYISESQRRLHEELCGAAPSASAQAEEGAAIELF